VLRASRRLREEGEQAGIPELTRPLFPLAPEGGHLLALAASGICQADGYYRGPYANGAVYFLVFETGLVVPPRSAQEIAVTLQGVVMTFAVDHRLMAVSYLHSEGFSVHDEGRMLHARADDGRELAVVFDDKGRMAGVTALA
jgi:hypothetical protein